MASSITKHPPENPTQWTFRFTSKRKADQGLPRQKSFYFPMHTFRKSDVQAIKKLYEQKYKRGEFDPWCEPITDLPAQKQASSSVISMANAIDLYMDQARRELTDHTADVHKYILKKMCSDFANPVISLLASDTKSLMDWVNASDAWNTRRSMKYYIERFLKWCNNQGYIDRVPELSAYSTKAERKDRSRDYITEAELQLLLDEVSAIKKKKMNITHSPTRRIEDSYKRISDLFTVMFYTGMRISEALHTRPAWIQDNYRFLQIGDLNRWNLPDSFTPKSQKEHDHPVVIPPEVQHIFRNRVKHCNGMYERLFGFRSSRWIQKQMKKACEKSFGKERAKNLSPHSLRHSCASYWLNERRIPVQEVQHLMRHSDISTTMGYHHPSQESHYAAFNSGVMSVMK